jgi:pilus assembly protein CpaF
MSEFKLIIRRPDKPQTIFDIGPGVYTIGSDDDCKLRLAHAQIDPRHAILTVNHDTCWIEDLDSPTGTCVSGERVTGRTQVKPGAPVQVGPFILVVQAADAAPPQQAPQPTAPEPVPAPAPDPAPPAAPVEIAPPPQPSPPSTPDPRPSASEPRLPEHIELRRSVKQQIHKELVERLDIKRLTMTRINKEELTQRARATIKDIVKDVKDKLPPNIHPDDLVKEICDEALGLGPLEDFLEDAQVTEIMVNGPSQVYVERNGRLEQSEKTFMDDASVLAIIERIVSPLGRRIDESQPYVDARLPDGSRVNAIIHPLSLVGPCLTIRKFSKTPFTDQDLIRFGTVIPEIAQFTDVCVKLRKNIVVSGGTGSGKTTLLNVLSNYLPEVDRIVTIEDAAELRLGQAHVVRLEARPPNIEGKGAVTIRDLVRNALRMRPDRIVVGECRGGEALDMLQAMNTGHDGSLTTVHANSPRDVISRLETMVLMSGMDLPVKAIREQIASAIDVIVHESRFSDGSRKVTKVTEIVGQEGEQVTMQDIFEYEQTGVDENGRVVGHFKPTGAVPTFIEEIASRGLTIDRTMFDPQRAQL